MHKYEKMNTMKLMEVQAEIDQMLQRRGFDDWNAQQVCLNHVANLICQNFQTEEKKESRLLALDAAIEHLSGTVKAARFCGPDHDIDDWENIDMIEAKKFHMHVTPKIGESKANEYSGAILAYALKMVKDCEGQNTRAAVLWQPMDERGNNWCLVLRWIEHRKPWDLFVVADEDEAKQVCQKMIAHDAKPSEVFGSQKKNTAKAS